MPEEESPVKELAGALTGIFSRIGEFFDLFDLSFFVSGATVLGAVAYHFATLDKFEFKQVEGVVGIGSVIVGSYVIGLLCYSTGRFVRRRVEWLWHVKFDALNPKTWWESKPFLQGDALTKLIDANKLADQLKRYRTGPSNQFTDHASDYLWTLLRHEKSLEPSLRFLNRSWVMAATYDGLGIAILAWLPALKLDSPLKNYGDWWLWTAIFIILSRSIFRRAAVFDYYQLAGIVSTYRWFKNTQTPQNQV